MPKCTICKKEGDVVIKWFDGIFCHDTCHTKKILLREFHRQFKVRLPALALSAKSDLADVFKNVENTDLAMAHIAKLLNHYVGTGLNEILDAIIKDMLLVGPVIKVMDHKTLVAEINNVTRALKAGLIEPDEAIKQINHLRHDALLEPLKKDQATFIQGIAGRGID